MHKFILYVAAALAGFLSFCPRGGNRPCPDPLKASLGLVLGALAAIPYFFLFVGKRALEPCDLLAVALIAFLFCHFIWTFFFAERAK